MNTLLLVQSALAQTVPPPIQTTETCGVLCDFMGPIVWGAPIVSGVIAFAVVSGVFAWRGKKAEEGWGSPGAPQITTGSLWTLPFIAGILAMAVIPVILAMIAFKNWYFYTLLAADIGHIGVILTWLLALVLGVMGRFFIWKISE
jgi:hypothetical protein